MKKVANWLFTAWFNEKSTWWANAVGVLIIIMLLGLIFR